MIGRKIRVHSCSFVAQCFPMPIQPHQSMPLTENWVCFAKCSRDRGPSHEFVFSLQPHATHSNRRWRPTHHPMLPTMGARVAAHHIGRELLTIVRHAVHVPDWSNGGSATQNVSPATSTTYTANFTTQYYLTMSASPSSEGTVNVSSGWLNAGQGVSITATPASGYLFAGFTGCGLSGTNQTQTCVMNGPETVVANFAAVGQVTQTITSAPTGLLVTVDGTQYTTPQNFAWTPGSSHTLAVTTSPQPTGATTTQYTNPTWNVSGAASASITAPSTSQTYTASFTTQYYLTTSSIGEGSISPASGWYNSGTVVAVTATPNSGYTFVDFTGALTGTTSPENLTMTAPESVTANFPLQGYILSAVPSSVSLTSTGTNDSYVFTAQWTDPSGDADNLLEVQVGFQTPPGDDYTTTHAQRMRHTVLPARERREWDHGRTGHAVSWGRDR